MKHLLTKLFLTFGSVCLWGNALHAQSYKIGANIPFAFHAGKSTLPAGDYVAEQPHSTQVQWLGGKDGDPKVAVATMSSLSDAKRQPRLVFHRYGDQYFLSEIWNGQGTGTRLHPTREEQAAKESVAANRAENVTVFMASAR